MHYGAKTIGITKMTNARNEHEKKRELDTKYGRCMTTTAVAALKIMQSTNKIMMHAWCTKKNPSARITEHN